METLGVLQINIDVDYLSQLGIELAKEGWIGIFDGEGNIIFTNWKEEEGEGEGNVSDFLILPFIFSH